MRVKMRTEPIAELLRERLRSAAGALQGWLRRFDTRSALSTLSRTLSGRRRPSSRPSQAIDSKRPDCWRCCQSPGTRDLRSATSSSPPRGRAGAITDRLCGRGSRLSVFADASAAVKRYADEEAADVVLRATPVFISELTRVEVISAIQRKSRDGQRHGCECRQPGRRLRARPHRGRWTHQPGLHRYPAGIRHP